ncbi:uncharacterized protein CLAFUR5_04226 [Fulvia fulva]|uniref:Uncharacterized protein n=1 Tax=Passalora fulva TaxID=5499 RepID=A0A9Q8LFQ9_PASFU|nr:uncharacterized protein CLAFUR5_04226 [Fulvia fulva]KAK4628278.1 hypothetical protein CLAFUR0_04248 [Fulvia fulva]UJO16579.1 hypothetical protein CLAFUR5_04226 [Fulvia fulva]WPV28924.1 hypothetical protein CLAFUW7_04249 [Fulvia fulva]
MVQRYGFAHVMRVRASGSLVRAIFSATAAFFLNTLALNTPANMTPKRKHEAAAVPSTAKRPRNTAEKNKKTEPKKTGRSTTVAKSKKSRNIRKDVKNGKPKTPGFFRLPPELRNRIYEDVLIEPGSKRTDVSSKVVEPALLLVCHKIRDEARPMWYLQNRFEITVMNCNAAKLIKFIARIDSISADAECDLLITLDGDRSRYNV